MDIQARKHLINRHFAARFDGPPTLWSRAPGRVDDPQPLTAYDPAHPYIIAMYDLAEAG